MSKKDNKPAAAEIFEPTRKLTDVEQFMVETHGIGGTEAVLAVSEINRDARRRTLEAKLARTKLALEQAKAEKPIELSYFVSGTSEMLVGKLPDVEKISVDDMIVELAMLAKHSGFGVTGSKSITIKAGFVAFVILHEALSAYFSVDLDTALVTEPDGFKIVHCRGNR